MNSHQHRSWNRLLKRAVSAIKKELSQESTQGTEKGQQSRTVLGYFRQPISGFGKTASFVAVVATLVGGWFWLRPSLSVEPYDTISPDNAFGEQFTIQNKSPYSLRDLQSGCFLLDEQFNVDGMRFTVPNVMFGLTKITSTLGSEDSTNTNCDAISHNSNVESADLLVDVEFRILIFRKTIRHRFLTRKDSTGRIFWVHASSPSFSTVPSVLEMPRPPIFGHPKQ